MNGFQEKRGEHKPPPPLHPDNDDQPGWADGLRQLYDSVLQETLPDSFLDLLQKLDQTEND